MGDFFAFRRMLAPVLIHIIFWVGVLGCLAGGGAILGGQIDPLEMSQTYLPVGVLKFGAVSGNLKLFMGLGIMILGPLFIRLYCELLMLPFRINGTLTDIRNTLIEQQEGTTPGTSRR